MPHGLGFLHMCTDNHFYFYIAGISVVVSRGRLVTGGTTTTWVIYSFSSDIPKHHNLLSLKPQVCLQIEAETYNRRIMEMNK